MGLPDHLTYLLRNLYAGQEATVRTGHKQWTGSKLRKDYVKAAYCHPTYLIYMQSTSYIRGFPDSSVGKESACNAGDPSSIPEEGRFPGEGRGYPHQDFWASLVAQSAKNLPAM